LTLVRDTREQLPLRTERYLPTTTGTLYSADYSVLGFEEAFAVERKSLADLCGSLTVGRGRFEHELHRMRGYRFKRLLIVGDPAQVGIATRSKIRPGSVFGSLAAYEARFDVPVIWENCEDRAARLVCRWAHYWFREQVRPWVTVGTCTIDPTFGKATLQVTPAPDRAELDG
jgi:ERCC4-type nuclease